jgi:hypothetical protein
MVIVMVIVVPVSTTLPAVIARPSARTSRRAIVEGL